MRSLVAEGGCLLEVRLVGTLSRLSPGTLRPRLLHAMYACISTFSTKRPGYNQYMSVSHPFLCAQASTTARWASRHTKAILALTWQDVLGHSW